MRSSHMVVGLYYPGDTLLHRVDPRAKLLASLAFVVTLFFLTSFAGLAILAAALLGAIILAQMPLSWLYRGFRPVMALILITFIFQLFLRGGEAWWHIGPLTAYREGARDGAFLGVRLVLLVLSGTVLTFTTSPVRLTDALSRLMSPLARLRFPAYQLALMITIALRFIPTLLIELDRVIKAQAARGADITRGGPFRRAAAVVPVLLPLFVTSFRHADDLAMAMESRCYRGGRGRTVWRQLSLGWLDLGFAAVTIILLAAGLWLGRLA